MKFKDTKYGDLTGQNYKRNIDVSDMKLTSLEGAPQIVQGNFDCNNNNLTTLEGAPQIVQGYFSCRINNLTSLKGAPELVNGNFYCQQNSLVSLKDLKGISNITSMYCDKNINKHLNKEFELRKENPTMSEEDINEKMYELTQSEYYLAQEAKDIFLF